MNRNCLRWFKGKLAAKAAEALDLLEQSIAQGYWVRGASRSVKSVLLTKAQIPIRLGRDNSWLSDVLLPGEKFLGTGYNIRLGLYGDLSRLATVNFSAMKKARAVGAEYRGVIEQAEQIAADFAEVSSAIAQLDATRPAPVFTTMAASPRVSKTLAELGAVSAAVCPIRWERRERAGKKGRKEYVMVAVLVWPEGTVHGASRFDKHSFSNCEACSHAIRNPFNWVPLVITSADGSSKSLWVGRDCAKTLFGVDFSGDLEIVGEDRSRS